MNTQPFEVLTLSTVQACPSSAYGTVAPIMPSLATLVAATAAYAGTPFVHGAIGRAPDCNREWAKIKMGG